MERLIRISGLVKTILEDYPETRNDDNLLWRYAVENYANKSGIPIGSMSFTFALNNIHAFGLPSYETVSRARRKLQNKYPELQATDRKKEKRKENEAKFREYAKVNGPV